MQGNHWVPWIHWTESHQFCGNKWYFLVNVGVALGNLLRCYLLPLLLSHFSRVRLCATPWTAAHQAPPSLGFSSQEHWSGLPFPSLMHETEKWKSCPTLATPWTAANQAPPSMGFSRQKNWSGLPLPSPMHESEKWKWSRSVVSDSQRPHGLRPTRLPCPWDLPGQEYWSGLPLSLRLNGVQGLS